MCPDGHFHSLEKGYLDAMGERVADSSTARTLASFGYEWNAFDDVRPEDEDFAKIYFKDVDLPRLRGLVGLDAGCGKGRFTRVMARSLSAVVALDGSNAVDAAVKNLNEMPNVFVVRADLRSPPLAPESFDFVACLGVLHHLDDPRGGFRRLVRYVAPKGQLLLYLYSRPTAFGSRKVGLALASALRKLTVLMPARLLEMSCCPIALALYGMVVIPGRFGADHGLSFLERLPMDTYRDKPWRSLVLDTFDRLSAPVEHRFVWSELAPWFDEVGLVVDSARDETGWFILAHRS